MKKNTKKKSAQSKAPANPPAATSPDPAPPASAPAAPTPSVVTELPPLEALLLEAQQEEDQAVLRQYARVIHVLREKSFSYREIAEWLNERGFQTDRNEVYRIYCKILRPDEKEQEYNEAQVEDHEEM